MHLDTETSTLVRRPEELLRVAHRPWDLPPGPWVMMQGWYNLLFAHWSLPERDLRSLIPEPLAIDTYEGIAWVDITPFHIRIRPRGMPVISHFPELNCRYVVFGSKPEVFFFSLDAGSWMAVWGARSVYRLPYFHSASLRNDFVTTTRLSRASHLRSSDEARSRLQRGSVTSEQRRPLQ